MTQLKRLRRIWFLLILILICLAWSSQLYAQTSESLNETRQKAAELLKQTNYVEAVPLLEKLVAAEPNNPQAHFYLASALLGLAANTKSEAERKAIRVKARAEFIRSKQLGINEPNVESMIQSLPPDGSDASAFSANAQADALMTEGEALFTQGKLDEALKKYQKALELDPKLYHAALFCGDVFLQKEDFANAEVWYQKAIVIDPNKETAYRYSATPLMKQQKTDEARDRYIEAFITEPYNRFARGGLIQWGQITRTPLANPAIDIPTDIKFDEKGDAKINLDANVIAGKDDGSFAWISYGIARSAWRKEKFAKTYPNEKTYRHSLPEEADALRAVIVMASSDKKTKTLSPSLAKLKKLNDEGLLEAYILLARVDEGISLDYPAYLAQNREKLRRFVKDYVVRGGGN